MPARPCAQMFSLVNEELGLFELARQLRELVRGGGLRERLAARARDIPAAAGAAGSTARADRSSTRSKRSLRARSPRSKSIARTSPHAVTHDAVRLAFVEIDLVAVIDRVLRTRDNACVAARARFEIERVRLLPADVERAKVTGDFHVAARIHGIAPLQRQFGAAGCARDQDADLQLAGQLFRPLQRDRGLADDQQLPVRLVRHHRHRRGLGQIGERQQRRNFRRRARGFRRPSRGLADIREADRLLLPRAARAPRETAAPPACRQPADRRRF